MGGDIFEKVDSRTDPDWIVKEFNSIYFQGRFLWALPLILERKGCGVNEDYCFFPDDSDPSPEYHFSGVKVGLMDSEKLLTEEDLSKFLHEACDKYVLLHPEDKSQLEGIMEEASLRGHSIRSDKGPEVVKEPSFRLTTSGPFFGDMVLTVVAQKRFSYTCYRDEHDAFILSVLCGRAGMYELNIPLSVEDAQRAQADGEFLDDLAESVRANPQDYSTRSIALKR